MTNFFEIEGQDIVEPVLEEEKVKQKGLFDWVKNISESKQRWTVDKSYVPYVINRAFMQYQDCIFIVNEANKLGISDPQAHYDFLFYSIPKRKRFAKWAKEEKHDFEQIIFYIMEKFCYNRKTAIDMYYSMTETEINLLKKEFTHGKA